MGRKIEEAFPANGRKLTEAEKIRVAEFNEKYKDQSIDIQILEIALKKIHAELDYLIDCCLDERGKVKAPDMRDIMHARGMLPYNFKNAFKKKEKNAN